MWKDTALLLERQDLAAWLDLYQSLGLAPIPLEPDSKVCSFKGWPDAHPEELWELAGQDANLGLRCGDGRLLVVDTDDQEAGEAIQRWRSGYGLRHVGAHTRRSDHTYLKTTAPPGFHAARLRGLKGEARGNRCYATAPPSVVRGWTYRLIGDLRAIPTVEWRDIQRLLADTVACYVTTSLPLPFQLLHRPLPEWCLDLSRQLRRAKPGQPVGGFDTRSEALCAILNTAHSLGWSFEQLHPAIKGIYPDRRLRADFERTYLYWRVEGNRPQIERLWGEAPTMFRGKTAATDGRVMNAILVLSFAGGADDDWMVHVRGIADQSQLDPKTVWRSLQRLMAWDQVVKARVKTMRGEHRGFRISPSFLSTESVGYVPSLGGRL